jgi:hypothetical protein
VSLAENAFFMGVSFVVILSVAAASSCTACVYSIYIRWPAIGECSNLLQQTLLLEVVGDDLDSLLHAGLLAVNVDLCVLGSLVRSADASELLDLASASLLVETLGVALLGNLEGDVNVDFDKRNGLVVVVCALSVKRASEVTVGPVGRDEGGDCYGGGVGEELGDLELWC